MGKKGKNKNKNNKNKNASHSVGKAHATNYQKNVLNSYNKTNQGSYGFLNQSYVQSNCRSNNYQPKNSMVQPNGNNYAPFVQVPTIDLTIDQNNNKPRTNSLGLKPYVNPPLFPSAHSSKPRSSFQSKFNNKRFVNKQNKPFSRAPVNKPKPMPKVVPKPTPKVTSESSKQTTTSQQDVYVPTPTPDNDKLNTDKMLLLQKYELVSDELIYTKNLLRLEKEKQPPSSIIELQEIHKSEIRVMKEQFNAKFNADRINREQFTKMKAQVLELKIKNENLQRELDLANDRNDFNKVCENTGFTKDAQYQKLLSELEDSKTNNKTWEGKIFKIGVELNKTKEELDEYKQLLQNNAAISQKLHDRVDDLNKENIKLRGDTSLLNMKSELKVKDNQIKRLGDVENELIKTQTDLKLNKLKLKDITRENESLKMNEKEDKNVIFGLRAELKELSDKLKKKDSKEIITIA